MKKISIISILSLLAIPAFAENVSGEVTSIPTKTETTTIQYGETALNEAPLVYETPKQMDFVEPIMQPQDNYRNPQTKFPHGLQLGIGVSPTSGLNAFIGYNNKNFDSFWAKRFGIRFDFATYSPIKERLNREINENIEDGIKIDDGLKINNFAISAKHIGAMVDFYPFGNTWFLGGFRVSGGYFSGNLELDSNIFAKDVGGQFQFELGDQKFYYDGGEMSGTATVDWKYSGPYAGLGFDMGLLLGLKLYFDAGVVFTNKVADIDINVPIDNLKHQGSGTAVTQSELDAAKDKALSDARKELDKYPYYPLVKLGIMYRF